MKTRNTKLETRNKPETPNPKRGVLDVDVPFGVSSLRFPSSFEFRISSFAASLLLAWAIMTSAAAAALPPDVKADGVADDTAAIQRALDALAPTGGVLELPPGQYRIHGTITVPTGVALAGSWQAPHHGVWDKGSTLLITGGRGSETGAAVVLSPSSAIRGFTMLWPEQRYDDIAPYPCAIAGSGMHGTVENITLVNAFQGVEFAGEWNELHLIRNVFGCALRRGIFIDNTSDIGRIENVHFNPHYWPRSRHPSAAGPGAPKIIGQYMADNLEAFIFGRTDWQYVTNTFVYAAKVGYRFIATENGACNGQLLGIGADFCRVGLQIDGIQTIGIQVTNGEFTAFAGEPNAAIFTAPGAGGAAQFVNCNFWATPGGAALLQGTTAVTFSGCHFLDVPETGAIVAEAGRLIVRSCNFRKFGAPAVVIGKGVRAAIVTGNLQPGGLVVENRMGPRAQIALNEPPVLTPDVLGHYRLNIGSAGDEGFVTSGWHGAESSGDAADVTRSARWTQGRATLKLPVVPGVAYTARVTASVPGPVKAVAIEAGGAKASADKPGVHTLELKIPAAERDRIELLITSGTWVPARVNTASTDDRTLGVHVFGVEMAAESAAGQAVDLNGLIGQ